MIQPLTRLDGQQVSLNLTGSPCWQVAQHDEPIRCIKYFEANGQGMLGQSVLASQREVVSCAFIEADPTRVPASTVTGSWDKVRNSFLHDECACSPTDGLYLPREQTLKYWDLRTPNPVATVQLPERCYGALSSPLQVGHQTVLNLTAG